MADFSNRSGIAALIGAIQEHQGDNECRDEVFWEISARIRECGEASKLDLLGLAAWWFGRLDKSTVDSLEGTTDAEIRDRTRWAFKSGLTDRQRIDWLDGLPVLGSWPSWMDRYGSRSRPRWTRIDDATRLLVLLACWNPDEYCIGRRLAIDYGLWSIARPVYAGRETLDYLTMVRDLRDQCRDAIPDVTAMDVDHGLHILGDRRRSRSD